MYDNMNVELNVSLLDIHCERQLFKAFLRPSRRLSTTSPRQPHKLSTALSSLSLQDAHTGTASLCFLPYIYFPLSCACSPILPSLSVLFTSLSSESFAPFFSCYSLASVSTAYIFYICPCFSASMTVCLFCCFHLNISFWIRSLKKEK